MSSTESSRDEAADLFNSSSLRFDARCLASAASSLACSFLKSVQLVSHLLFKLFSTRSKSLISSFKVLCSRSKVAILAFNLACLVRASDNFRKLDRAGFDGFFSLEWVKRWNPDLQEPGIVFAHYKNYMDSLAE